MVFLSWSKKKIFSWRPERETERDRQKEHKIIRLKKKHKDLILAVPVLYVRSRIHRYLVYIHTFITYMSTEGIYKYTHAASQHLY